MIGFLIEFQKQRNRQNIPERRRVRGNDDIGEFRQVRFRCLLGQRLQLDGNGMIRQFLRQMDTVHGTGNNNQLRAGTDVPVVDHMENRPAFVRRHFVETVQQDQQPGAPLRIPAAVRQVKNFLPVFIGQLSYILR